MVDPGDDQVGPLAEQAEVAEPHAVDRRAVGRVSDRAVVELDLLDQSGDRVVMLRAVALRFESGAITWVSTPSSSPSARRSAWRPSAPIPSSLVSRTRITRSILGVGGRHNQGVNARGERLTVGANAA